MFSTQIRMFVYGHVDDNKSKLFLYKLLLKILLGNIRSFVPYNKVYEVYFRIALQHK